MNKMLIGCAAATACCLTAAAVETFGSNEKYRPRLFASFGEEVNEPDGLTQDARGNIYHSAPNHLSKVFPIGQIMKRCAKTGQWKIFCQGAISPLTGKARPMGLEWCPEDGNLYYCDNQYFDSKEYASRIMRVVLDQKTGEPLRIETAVEKVKLANAIRFYKGDMFFTDTFFDLNRADGVGVGGVYRIPLADCRDKAVWLLPKPDRAKDPYFVCGTETVVLPGRGDESGADGLAITANGDLYFGTFGSGRFYTNKRRADGTYAKESTLLMAEPAVFACCDGICYDAKKNRIIMSDSALNALHTWDIAKEKDGWKAAFGELWRNGDTDGADGLFDQPCEPMIWTDPADGRRKCVVANFDMAFPGLTNKTNDKFHTLSVLDVD